MVYLIEAIMRQRTKRPALFYASVYGLAGVLVGTLMYGLGQKHGASLGLSVSPTPAAAVGASPASTPPLAAPDRPAGVVPQVLIGAWSGGEGSADDYTLKFMSNNQYVLIHRTSPGIPAFVEMGYVGGSGQSLTLQPVKVSGVSDRQERTVQWTIQTSGADLGDPIDVLTLQDPVDGQFSYVRN